MSIEQTVIEELRCMFKEGATPSRLIQHVVARHPNAGNWHQLIQDYFREGFGVPIVRGLDPAENYDDVDLHYAYLNEDVLAQMVQTREEWDSGEDSSSSWLDSLMATDPGDRLQAVKQAGVPTDFSESWDCLSESERHAIALAASSLKGRTEVVHVLARLAERLQQRIIALERGQAEQSARESSGNKRPDRA